MAEGRDSQSVAAAAATLASVAAARDAQGSIEVGRLAAVAAAAAGIIQRGRWQQRLRSAAARAEAAEADATEAREVGARERAFAEGQSNGLEALRLEALADAEP